MSTCWKVLYVVDRALPQFARLQRKNVFGVPGN